MRHLEKHGVLGIEPWSLNCCVVDVDGGPKADGSLPSPEELAGLAKRVIDWIGAEPFAVFPSASGRETGKCHLWFLLPDSCETPLGTRREKGKTVARKCSTGLLFDGPGTQIDTRCINSIIRFDTYASELAGAYNEALDNPQGDASRLAELDAHGNRHKRSRLKGPAKANAAWLDACAPLPEGGRNFTRRSAPSATSAGGSTLGTPASRRRRRTGSERRG